MNAYNFIRGIVPLFLLRPILRFKSLWQTYGFGVQSPTAYRFLSNVLREKHLYYAYDSIHELAQQSQVGCYEGQLKLYFRLANYFQISKVCLLDIRHSKLIEQAIQLGRHSVAVDIMTTRLLSTCPIGSFDLFVVSMDKMTEQDLLQLIDLSTVHQVIIVEDIYKNKLCFQRWRHLVRSQKIYQSFDLSCCGILFLDSTKSKRHYFVNMKS